MTTLFERIIALEAAIDSFEDDIAERHQKSLPRQTTARDVEGVPPDVLTIGLVGGTGVGKSSLVNALARGPISQASSRRPTTDRVVPYVHRDRVPLLEDMRALDGRLTESFEPHAIDALRSVILFDLPDIDSLEMANADTVREVIGSLDVVVWVTSLTKYGDRELDEWIRRYAAGMNLDNFAFVLNKVDEIRELDADSAVQELARRFESSLRKSLDGLTLEGSPRWFLISALHAREDIPGNAFSDLETWLFHERDARELERLKSSNRFALAGHRIGDLRAGLLLEERRERLTAERRDVAERLRQVVAHSEIKKEVEKHVRESTAENEAARRIFLAELATWPLLPHLRVLTAPLRQAARALTRAQLLAGSDDAETPRPDSPLPRLLDALFEVQTERRRKRSLRVDDGPAPPDPVRDRAELAAWIRGLANECVARVRAASAKDISELRVVGPVGFLTRHAAVWGPLLWFPLLQPILQEVLNPTPGLASLPLRLVHRLVRITGAMHLLVSMLFVLLVYVVIIVWLRAQAWRAASRRCRELLESQWWTQDLESKLVSLVLGDVEEAMEMVEDEAERLTKIETELEELKARVVER